MKEFKINEQQLSQIANILLEFPAKNVLPAIDILRNLIVIEECKSNTMEN